MFDEGWWLFQPTPSKTLITCQRHVEGIVIPFVFGCMNLANLAISSLSGWWYTYPSEK
jgi:hypothetical protein